MVAQNGFSPQQEQMLHADDFFRGAAQQPMNDRMQFRRMYRYGLGLLILGIICNWIGFAQSYFAPIRYLGVGCVLAGALCVCIALCRWLTVRHLASEQELPCEGMPSIHVITVPIVHSESRTAEPISKPPDYETVVGSCPPSYDEAIQATPSAFLHPSATVYQPPPPPDSPAPPYIRHAPVQAYPTDNVSPANYIERIHSMWSTCNRRGN